MTKRVLSLLLTLVMVLSLCVPALAADEFEAEAPAEVVEEAPAAPVEPEAPEAEEPAEEPVVVDEPEAAAIIADEPMEASLAVDAADIAKLQAAYNAALDLETKAKANEIHIKGQDNSTAFLEAMETARKIFLAYEAVDMQYNYSTATVQATTKALEGYAAEGAMSSELVQSQINWLNGPNTIRDTLHFTLAEAQVYNLPGFGALYNTWPGPEATQASRWVWGDRVFGMDDAAFIAFAGKLTTDVNYTRAFHADYLKELQAAIREFDYLKKDANDATKKANVTFKMVADLKAELESLAAGNGTTMDATKNAKFIKAITPNADDDAALKKAYEDALAAFKTVTADNANSGSYQLANLYNAWGAKADGSVADSPAYYRSINANNSETLASTLTDYFTETTDNGREASRALLFIYSRRIADLKSFTANIDDFKNIYKIHFDEDVPYEFSSDKLGVIVHVVSDATDANNSNYYLGYKVGEVNRKFDGGALYANTFASGVTLVDSTDHVADVTLRNVDSTITGNVNNGAGSKAFTKNDIIKVQLYYYHNIGVNAWYEPVGDALEIQMRDDEYVGPEFWNGTTADYDEVPAYEAGTGTTDTIYYAVDADIASTAIASYTIEVGGKLGKPYNAKMKTNTPLAANSSGNIVRATEASATVANTVAIPAGEVSIGLVELNVRVGTLTENLVRSQTTITVPSITTYGNERTKSGYYGLVADIAKADEALTKGYIGANGKTTADAVAALKAAKKDADAFVAAAAGYGNCAYYRGKVDTYDAALIAALKNVVEGADMTALTTAIAAAEALKESDYTADSWGALQTALKAAKAEAAKNHKKGDKVAEKAIADAAATLNAAIEALVGKPGDNTALKASITAAETALKDKAKYTDESVKAVEDALAAAEKVAADAKATQTAIDAAKKALDDAVAALKEKTAEPTLPTAPAGWSGWKQDTAGSWYYFRSGELKKNYWVTDASAHDLWYHVGADGKMDTGFKYIVDKTHGSGWFMLQASTTNGMQGAALTGWQATGTAAGDGYFEPTHNGHYAECTWTKAWGDNNFKTGVWTDGQQHVG